METVGTLIKRYLNNLTRELDLLLHNKRSVEDFISRFHFLIDEMPLGLPEEVVNEIEDLNDVISRYEPNLNERRKEPVFTGEEEIKEESIKLLEKIKKISI